MKRFFVALCVFCLTAVFASAEEPELIERPLSWTIDSIQIVWNIEEKQTENYEWRAISDRSKSTSVDNSNLSRDTNSTMDTSSKQFSADADASVKGGIGFDRGFFASWGLQGSAGMSTGLGWKKEDSTANTQQNEWVKSENTTAKATESEDTSKGNQTLRYNRKLLFTVNFVNHSDQTLLMALDSENTIPIYCGGDHLGNAHPVITIDRIFRIPATGNPYPCQFEMELNDSSKAKLLQSVPDIRILGGQIRVYNDEYEDAFTQSIKQFPHFTVRLTADGASRDWEFRYNKKSNYTLQEVFETINDDCEAEDLFDLGDDGAIISVASFPVKPTRASQVFVLLAWNGEPVSGLKDLKPRKNRILDVILISRAILETRQRDTLNTLVPFKESLEKWAKDGLFDGKYLTWNLMNKEERLPEIKQLAEAGDIEMLRELEQQIKAGERIVLTVDGIEYAFRWCPAGEFMMGSPTDEPGRYDHETRHRVRLTKGFWMLETEVTQAQWKAIMGTTVEEQAHKMLNDDKEYNFESLGTKKIRDIYVLWGFPLGTPAKKILCGEGADRPIYFVNWSECEEFCYRLSSRLNQLVKLPTEAQWEYACRAGSTTALPNGPIEIKGLLNAPALDPIAWYGGNSSQGFTGQSTWNSSSWPETQYPGGPCGVHPVGKQDANAWGLYDMNGNVGEWCSDYADAVYYDLSPTIDPENTTPSSYRVNRGGSWGTDAGTCRSASRGRSDPGNRNHLLGLRVILVPSSEE